MGSKLQILYLREEFGHSYWRSMFRTNASIQGIFLYCISTYVLNIYPISSITVDL